MTYADSRLVQTAVIGSRGSDRAIILPTDADELARWRRRHPTYSYWCGTLLGGCGNELSDRLYRDKVCHFAHHAHTSCHRTATGASSADHLFVKGDLTAWAGRRRLKARASLRNLGTGPGDAVDFRVREARQHVRFQFRKLAHAEWADAAGRLIRDSVTVDWVFGPGAAHPATMEELYDVHGYLLRFRCETQGAARRVRLRAEDPRRSTDWVPLDACVMTPEGLRLPGMRGPRRHTRPAVSVPKVPAPSAARMPQSREELVAAVRQALVSAARLRTRPTWESLSRAAGLDLSAICDAERVRLLVEVDETAGREGRPLLSALLRTDEGGTPVYLEQVSRAVGCGSPATAAVLKHWCQREVDRAFAVHGTPPRTPPPRLEIDRDGHIAADSAPPQQPRVIVHSRGELLQDDRYRQARDLNRAEKLRRDLATARNDRALRLVAALIREGEEVIPLLSRAQSAQLRAEVVDARNWLRSHLAKGARKGKKKNAKSEQSARAATARSAKSKRKRQQGRMNGDRPLPGHRW
ncbi:competence protein CoiA family protein [Streptomyces sp. NPDC007856]|uniref:competence protein CoiA family protein n=1 Tax=Streptomyces sp. NPDC007856 TaxID=3364781 RepID=UPI00369606D6